MEQTEHAKSALYFYMKSIEYAQISLEFEMSIEKKEQIIKYIRYRYKDIGDYKILDDFKILDDEDVNIRARAYEIYNVLNEYYSNNITSNEIK